MLVYIFILQADDMYWNSDMRRSTTTNLRQQLRPQCIDISGA